MREINRDLFDQRKVMEPEFSRSFRVSNFGFAFNDSNFCDRILRIEILSIPSDSKSDDEVAVSAEEQVLNQSDDDDDDVLGDENDGEGAVSMIEESLSGDEEGNSHDLSWSTESTPGPRVQFLHISSPILAAKSPFFYKVFHVLLATSKRRHWVPSTYLCMLGNRAK